MTTATATDQQAELERERSEGFVTAANWIQEHQCGYRVSVVGWSHRNNRPLIMLRAVEDMKDLFPGVTVDVKKDCTSTRYQATVEGIDFETSRYGCSESPTKWTEVL